MGRFVKRFLFFGFISFLGYLVVTFYSKIKAAINLEKSLPEYIKSIYETEVEIDITIALNNYKITINCDDELMKKIDLVKKTVVDYLDDFYPELNKKYIDIQLKLKEEPSEE
ncbi:hypothetical protein ACFLYK_00680 [Candidatus Cloacimonadota bacterium]